MLQGEEHGDRSVKHRLEMMDQMKKKGENQKTSILIVTIQYYLMVRQ